MKRKICVLTTSRADYNHLFVLMNALKSSKGIDFRLIVTGMHTLRKYGYTCQEIVNDGFKPDCIVNSNQKNTNAKDIIKSMSTQLDKAYDAMTKINPDMLVVLGDRYDMYPFALASHIIGIPLVHFHGGEVTSGAIDDALRHSVSKLSDIHFVANQEFKKRLIQLGERKKYIFNIGSLGIDSIRKIKFKKRDYVNNIDVKIKNNKYFMISLHPETINGKNLSLSENLLKSLKKYGQYIQIFSYPNSDSESNIILEHIKKYVSHNDNAILHQSYGRIDYLHLLKYSEILIGNSSSGFVEAPYLETPTVNVGTRQKGRPTTDSIFNSSYSATSIISNINLALNYKNSRKNINYKAMDSVDKVMKILKTIKIDNIKNKSFVDIA
tara:strand:+ start:11865 stop:13007 length:1143 start_codon:yes stop_codon:yes gene_type:complete